MYADNAGNDLLQKADDKALQKAKEEFANFVISVENTIDNAIELGKARDVHMLAVLRELNTVQDDLLALSQSAHEEVPNHNYHTEVTRIIREYIEGIIENEYQKIAQLQESGSDSAQEAPMRVNQLQNIIHFYDNEYPELHLGEWSKKLNF
jgi:glutamyl-tRNA reductase